MKNSIAPIALSIILFSCSENKKPEAVENTPTGKFVFNLKLNDSADNLLPFFIDIQEKSASVLNDTEVIEVKDYFYSPDSISFRMPVFDSHVSAKFENGTWSGTWQDKSRGDDYIVNLFSYKTDHKFQWVKESPDLIKSEYKITFSPNTDDAYEAIAYFKQEGNKLSGTFRTETGDYRFLDGNVGSKDGHTAFALSCFDGGHAFLFEGIFNGDELDGTFYSGEHWNEPFTGKIDTEFELADPDTLTYIKEGYDVFDFSFPNLNGDTVTFSDAYKGQVTVVQIMGSWCPNCMDETMYLASVYEKYKDQGLKIVALAFEKSGDWEKATSAVNRLKSDLNANYDFLIAGTSRKSDASEALPMLNHIMSYPTTIVLDHEGNVAYIHTGFNGPSTGVVYDEFKIYFEGLLNEKLSKVQPAI